MHSTKTIGSRVRFQPPLGMVNVPGVATEFMLTYP